MRLITTTGDLEILCNELAGHPFATVDTEFMREQTYWPQLCLIQLAGPNSEAVIDPLAEGINLAPFFALMANRDVVKVFHAARQDIEIAFAKTGAVPEPIFDTQVAAMVCGFGESISYVNLVKKLTGADLDKSSRFTDWSRRPLSDKQLAYALGDVTHLRDVYKALQKDITNTGRMPWVAEEMALLCDPATYDADPERAWQRLKLRVKGKKPLAVLIELAAWRERLAQTQDVPRGRILRDEALYDIANQLPGTTERDMKLLPKVDRGEPLSAQASATLELLKVLLRSAAAEHGVATRLIADSEDLERLATEAEPDVLALKGWRRTLFGEAALKLKRGELALTLVKGEVRAVPASRA